MDFSAVALTETQQAFAREVRDFLDEQLTPEVYAGIRAQAASWDEGFYLAMGARGWLWPRWKKEDGGAELDDVSVKILETELERRDAPITALSLTGLVWPAVEAHGDPGLRDELKPGIARGTKRICIGYTEPDGGSDIAAAKVRAVRDGDEWVINGSKIFTTGAQNCQYTFLITRTDPDLPKHKGLTMFLVPLDTPGVEIQALRTFAVERTNIVYYSDVRISDKYRLGGVNDGWSVLHGPLDEEHSIGGDGDKFGDLSVGTQFVSELSRALDVAVAWATTPRADGSRPADDTLVRYRLGQIEMDIQAALCTPGPLGRVKCSETLVHGAAALIDLVGPEALVSEGAEGALGGGYIDFAHRYAQGTATYGGTVEVFRGIIAQHVLGLPRPSYPGSKVLVQKKR